MIDRNKIPKNIKIKAPNIVRSKPNVLPILEAKNDTIPNAIKGTTVIKLSALLVVCNVSLIEGNATPTDVMGARKLAATNIIPTTNNKLMCLSNFSLGMTIPPFDRC